MDLREEIFFPGYFKEENQREQQAKSYEEINDTNKLKNIGISHDVQKEES